MIGDHVGGDVLPGEPGTDERQVEVPVGVGAEPVAVEREERLARLHGVITEQGGSALPVCRHGDEVDVGVGLDAVSSGCDGERCKLHGFLPAPVDPATSMNPMPTRGPVATPVSPGHPPVDPDPGTTNAPAR